MQDRPTIIVPALTLALLLFACSPPAPEQGKGAPATEMADPAATPANTPAREEATPAPPMAAPAKIIGLEGLGELRIGQAVPTGGSWAEYGAQVGAECRTVTSPDYPGVYAIVTDGKVQRITVGQNSDVKLVEGIGVGATEVDVRKWFAGFRATPHKYVDAPAKYLTAPNAESGDPALRFEIGEDGKVKMIHIGAMPVLGYVEGCA